MHQIYFQKRDHEILGHLRRYRITTNETLHESFCTSGATAPDVRRFHLVRPTSALSDVMSQNRPRSGSGPFLGL